MGKNEVFDCIGDLLGAGYEIKLSETSIELIEPYKSEVADRWEEKSVASSIGLEYFTDGCLHITSNTLKSWTRNYLPEKPT